MNPKRQSKTSPVPARPVRLLPGGYENGFIIIAVIALIAILALVGTVGVLTTSTEIKISSNYKTGVQAFHASQAGADEARARLRGPSTSSVYIGDTTSPPYNELWSVYVGTSSSWETSDDPDYDNSYTNVGEDSLQSDISYWVKVRHKKWSDCTTDEQDLAVDTSMFLPSDPLDIIYYGYGTSTSTTLKQFTTNGDPYMGSPVEIITSYGSSGSGSGIIEIQAIKLSGPPVVSALYGETVDGAGNVTVIGDDNCSSVDSLPAVGYVTSTSFVGSPTLTSDVGTSTQITPALELEEQVTAMESMKTVTLTGDQTNYTIGSSSNYEVVYCDATILSPDAELDLTTQGLGGYGTLVVEGDLSFTGNIIWHGLIIASGSITFSGGGTKEIYGAVMGTDVVDLVGTVEIYYNSCEIEKANGSYRYSAFRWKDKKLD
ncbi:MAG: hypothetical protein V3V70_04945 [Candidatus Scalindua sp.]